MRIASATAPNNLEVGEEVVRQLNENNAVVDVHRKGDASLSPSATRDEGHRHVTRLRRDPFVTGINRWRAAVPVR